MLLYFFKCTVCHEEWIYEKENSRCIQCGTMNHYIKIIDADEIDSPKK